MTALARARRAAEAGASVVVWTVAGLELMAPIVATGDEEVCRRVPWDAAAGPPSTPLAVSK
jgi:hypothetical protein